MDEISSQDITISALCEESAAIAKKSGFSGQSLPEFVALVHSELSEALEEHRAGFKPAEVRYSVFSQKVADAIREELKLDAEDLLPKGISAHIPCSKDHPGAKPEGIPSELADVVIRVAHYAGANGIDLAAAIREKAAYNKTRPYKHGGKVL